MKDKEKRNERRRRVDVSSGRGFLKMRFLDYLDRPVITEVDYGDRREVIVEVPRTYFLCPVLEEGFLVLPRDEKMIERKPILLVFLEKKGGDALAHAVYEEGEKRRLIENNRCYG